MTRDDEPRDLDARQFERDLDEPRATATDQTRTDAAADDVWDDDDWGDDPVDGSGRGGEPGSGVADEWVRPAGQSSSLFLLIGAVVLVMVGVVVFLAISGDDESDSGDASAPTPASGGIPAEGGEVPPPVTTPDPGTDPDLDDVATLTDDFERPDGELGTLPGGAPWVNQRGAIAIQRGVARTLEVDPEAGLQLTTVDIGANDVTMEVRLPSPVDRSGLAIRVASPDRFIGLFATSEYGTYTLARFENGSYSEDDVIGNTDLAGAVNDVIGIRATGSKVEVLVNGTVRNSYDDPKLEIEGTSVGLFAFLDDSGPKPVDAREFANWDDLKVLPG